MAKYFTDITLMMREKHLGPPNEFMFKAKDITLTSSVSNTIRRAMARMIPTYSVAPETIHYEVNTSPWDPDMIGLQLVSMEFYPDLLDKMDLNMIEINLNVTNSHKSYRYVFAHEIEIINKETKEKVLTDHVIIYPYQPLFTLGEGEQVHLKCSIEKMTKEEAERKAKSTGSAHHQSATCGIDFEVNEKEPDVDPKEVLFTVNNQSGLDCKRLVGLAIENIVKSFQNLQEAIKTRKQDKFYVQLNKYFRYDFVFLDEDHTTGNIIERWINRHDPKSIAGYRQSRNRKSIILDFGLSKFVPLVLHTQQTSKSHDLEEVVEKSITSLDKKKEEEQRLETIRVLLEHLSRIEEYFKSLSDDWKKVSVNEVSVKDYMKEIEQLRRKRIDT